MSEAEQLRQEIAELRKRLAVLESREARINEAAYRFHQKEREAALRMAEAVQPTFVREMLPRFPPGTILC